jgi:microcin C transport system ATP-binding protein
VKAVDGVDDHHPRRADGGHRRRVGSGKTTLGLALLRLIASEGPIVSSTGSDIDTPEARLPTMRPLRKEMQIVFQDPYRFAQSPRLSVAEIVEPKACSCRTRPHSLRRAPTSAWLRRLSDVGLDPAAHGPLPARVFRRPAPAHRHRPRAGAGARLVVLDEPTSALDMSVQAQIVDLLRDLQQQATVWPTCSSATISRSCARWPTRCW